MARRADLVVVAVAVLAAFAVVVGAHGNHVAVDAQVVGDGRVVVESYFSATGGFLVIHADDGGEPGRVLGHVAAPQGQYADLAVPVEGDAIPAEGSTTLWAVLHRDDGDGEFEPGEDPPIEAFGSVAGSTFRVRPGDDPVAVVAGGQSERRSEGSVTLDRVALADPGYVVVRANDRGQPGEVVGHADLDPGTHRNVTVDLDPSYFEAQSTSFDAHAVVYASDGDGAFDPDADRPVTVGGEPVATTFVVIKNATGSVDVVTPGSTTTAADPGVAGDRTGGDGGNGDGGDGGENGGGGSDPAQPGFGVAIAAVAVVVALVVRRWR